MCLTDWTEELGKNAMGNTVYPSLEALKSERSCFYECGIVKVEVKALKVVQKPASMIERIRKKK